MDKTIQDLASDVLKQMTQSTRDNGEKFFHLKEDSPDWMQDLCRDAHGRMGPDDFIYQFIFESLDALSNDDDTDDARNSLEADCYTSDLTSWLSSSNGRMGYVDDAVNDGLVNTSNFSLSDALMAGQLQEKNNVFESVLSSLESHLEELEAA